MNQVIISIIAAGPQIQKTDLEHEEDQTIKVAEKQVKAIALIIFNPTTATRINKAWIT